MYANHFKTRLTRRSYIHTIALLLDGKTYNFEPYKMQIADAD
jgi:hypothetical protein